MCPLPLTTSLQGPVTEELLFRSSILAVSLLGHLSTKWMIFGTPLWFGLGRSRVVSWCGTVPPALCGALRHPSCTDCFHPPAAHVHHAINVFHQLGGTRKAAASAATSAVFQLGYTSLFGWLASFVYLRTGSVLPPLAAHIFCNYMGLPDIVGAMQRHPNRKLCESRRRDGCVVVLTPPQL